MIDQESKVVRAPGRINLIGEHTDYNEGYVLPAGIDRYVTVRIGRGKPGQISLYSSAMGESVEVGIGSISPRSGHWSNYVLGVVAQLMKRGVEIPGFSAEISSSIPMGAGLSSSAALESAVVYGLNALLGLSLSRTEMVQIAQSAEHEYAGVNCGIMDMYASIHSRQDHAILLDCRTVSGMQVPLNLGSYQIVLLDTGIKHKLASSAYNQRRMECEEGVRQIREQEPSVRSLRDVSAGMVEKYVRDERIQKRCKYVIAENNRVLAGCEDLSAGRIGSFGKRLYESHAGLSQGYEVSCPELDYLVGIAGDCAGVAGARMMGGGFGGCTINLVEGSSVAGFIDRASQYYREVFSLDLESYVVKSADGASIQEQKEQER